MNYQYICPKHAIEVQHDEAAAMELWEEFMNRGVRDYALCRWENAFAFLGTAFEVAAIRVGVKSNDYFCNNNLLRPFEFMFEMLISDNDYNNATNHLIHTFNLVGLKDTDYRGEETFELQGYSVKLIEKISNSMLTCEHKNHLINACNATFSYCEKMSVH